MSLQGFVPRPIYRVKHYGYVVEKKDTPSGIAKKFGRPLGAYRELVAANLYGRPLMPMALGSPYPSRTFASLAEGEVLRIPAHWPDVPGAPPKPEKVGTVGAPGKLGEQSFDPIANGIISVVQQASKAAGGAYDDQATAQSIVNAAVQWWHNVQGTTAPADPSAYLPFVQSAIGWFNTFGQQIGTQLSSTFPWGAFLNMLPAMPDLTTVDWAGGTIPGTNGIPWTSIPWAMLGQFGTALETLKLPPVQWPQDTSASAVAAAIGAAIASAQAAAGGGGAGGGTTPTPGPTPDTSCASGGVYDGSAPGGAGCYACTNGQVYDLPSHTCICPSGTVWDPKAPNGGQCLPPPKSQSDCYQDEVFDAQGPSGPHCYYCDPPLHYDPSSHQCACPQGQSWNGSTCVSGAITPQKPPTPGGGPGTPAPPPTKTTGGGATTAVAAPASNTGLLVGAIAAVAAVAIGGVFIATRPAKPEPKKSTRRSHT